MKVICVGRNYIDHAKELQNEIPSTPVIFLKPDTALLRNNASFYLPEFSKEIHHEVELVLKVSKEGKHIQEKFADAYYDEVSLGIDFTARDLQNELKSKGLPWELSKSFDGSAVIGEFVAKEVLPVNFSLHINGELRQKGNTTQMIFNFEKIIAFVSQYITLKKGDLIYTGTPAGVSKVKIGDRLEGFLENKRLFDFYVR